eukprot:CAMPEP_0174262112 /NCGR_PEP_ID=MMETSP0439-20130205/12777_1 /TAXON_ID=0 /ORGANISM="Stereomyxa ramosa, Strain Chinc5" /LENGTH=807 /DNA_ID=CAMNT_0015346753 /DNA_START=226 /DNA_END=2649 /DNA_ORIENTATION=-
MTFFNQKKESIAFPQLSELLHSLTERQLDQLMALTMASPSNIPQQTQLTEEEKADREMMAKLPKSTRDSFGLLVQLYHLHDLLSKLSILQLMKIFEFIPSAPKVQQLQLLQQLQQLLGQLLPEALISLQKEVEAKPTNDQHQVLVQLLQLRKEHFHLYQPLRLLLQLGSEELLGLQEILPKLQPIQMLHLLTLLQMQPFEVLELKRVFQTPTEHSGEMTIQPTVVQEGSVKVINSTFGHLLRIVEQPPEKSVYKRNLKPNPTVQLEDNEDISMESNLFVAPVLIRCDTLEEKPDLLTGNKPVKIAPGRVVSFRRLKITATSHQQGESLFAIKFELRRYHGNEYEILDFVQSNPICVLSHSTQLKPASSTTASVVEVIPYSGSTFGGTRVAVLGNNFVESPSSRVRFDNIDVMPTFHGPRTLICTTPQHQPGIVSVRVSNDSKCWSSTAASFTYEEKDDSTSQMSSADVSQQYDFPGLDIAGSICEAAWQGGYETVKLMCEEGESVDMIDQNGYTALHYSTSAGFNHITDYLLAQGANLHIRDRSVNTPLYWATFAGNLEGTKLLVEHGGKINAANVEGWTCLYPPVCFSDLELVSYLCDHGAYVNMPAQDNITLLHVASGIGNDGVVQLLVKYGAHVNARDIHGETPLHYACRSGNLSCAKILVANGASVSFSDKEQQTPLHVAAFCGEDMMVSFLLSKGAHPDARDSFGATPLFEACQGGSRPTVELLVGSGASASMKDYFGKSAFSYCQESSQIQLAEFLLCEGVLPLTLSDYHVKEFSEDMRNTVHFGMKLSTTALSMTQQLVK